MPAPSQALPWLTGIAAGISAVGQELPANHPNPEAAQKVKNPTITVYGADSGFGVVVKAKGGPFGSFPVDVNNMSPKDKNSLENWFQGDESGEGAGKEADAQAPQPEEIDPFEMELQNNVLVSKLKGKKREENIDRLRKAESTFPGYLKTITGFYNNVKDGITERYGKVEMKDGKYTSEIKESTLISKLIGGKTEGSVTHNIVQEIEGGDVRRESKSEDKVLFARDTTDVGQLQGVMSTFDRLGQAYKKLTRCESTESDHKFIRENIRHDPSSGAYFYKDPTSNNNFGMALSLAGQNIMNLVGEEYNKRVDECDNIEDKESAKIPTMEIKPVIRAGGTSYSNIVKEASERVVEIAFLASKGNLEEAGEKLSGFVTEFGKNVFIALNAKRRADRGQQIVDEEYSAVFDHIDFLGIETDDDIEKVAREHFLPYFSEVYDDMKILNPDYVTRVGGGSVGAGDKTDVDYVWKEKPNLEGTDFEEGGITKVKFDDLDPVTQRSIRRSGEGVQDTYYRLDDSLKYYGKEGDVKLGDSSSARTSLGRLIGIAPSTSRNPQRDIEHGRKTMASIRESLSKNEGLDVNKTMKDVEKLISNIHKASENVSKLMDTDSWTNPNYKDSASKKKMIRTHLTNLFENAGLGYFNDYVKVNDVLEVWSKDGPDQAAGMIDRAIIQGMLSKNIVEKKGKIDKEKSLVGLAAFAALHASTSIDTANNRNPMSSIKIKETGNIYRENQTRMVMDPLDDLLNVNKPRGLARGQQTWRIDRDGSFQFAADKRRCSGTSYISTTHLKSKSDKKN